MVALRTSNILPINQFKIPACRQAGKSQNSKIGCKSSSVWAIKKGHHKKRLEAGRNQFKIQKSKIKSLKAFDF